MSKPSASSTSTTGSSLLTHAQWIHLRQEAQLRRQTLATFGPQGVLDLALVGAILGNNIREIGRYSVTCDGSLVRGRYTIYELVHFGALAVTGRQSQPRRRGSNSSIDLTTTTQSTKASKTTTTTTATGTRTGNGVVKVYPTTLSNLFPVMVFKAMRRKAVRPPKFQHDDEDDRYSSMPSTPTLFPMSPLTATPPKSALSDSGSDRCTSSPTPSFASTTSTTTTSSASSIASTSMTADAMLITSEAVLSHLIQHRLHRVKDLPLPRELCFIGAASLPLPPVLRAMHVAWTMDFLKVCATTPRRQRQQLRRLQEADPAFTKGQAAATLGGLDFRPDIYAHKMRLARLVRAQLIQQQEQKAASSSSSSSVSPSTTPPSVGNSTLSSSPSMTTTPGSGYSHHRLSASMRHGPSSVSIPEENEDEDQLSSTDTQSQDSSSSVAIPLRSEPAVSVITPTPSPGLAPPCTTPFKAKKSVRQDKRLMQQLLALENKVPRIVRQWAKVARTCFEGELIQEDREVQVWVDRQRIQVALGCGYRFGASSSTSSIATIATTSSSSTATTVTTTATATTRSGATSPSRPRLSPIATAYANANANNPSFSRTKSAQPTRHQHVPSYSSSTSPAPTRACFPEGIRLSAVGPQQPYSHQVQQLQQQQQQQPQYQQQQHYRPHSTAPSRPTSATMNDRLSASQQMLSMHLWLSLLVSPLSPKHMIQDQFSFLDS
ncbi:hypothetical protein FBU30_003312 [Linnemannia zychae]|nr:hypothetical protein FBU30_003312 [Linnemannia zychae]